MLRFARKFFNLRLEIRTVQSMVALNRYFTWRPQRNAGDIYRRSDYYLFHLMLTAVTYCKEKPRGAVRHENKKGENDQTGRLPSRREP
jgi:hypothetical protein